MCACMHVCVCAHACVCVCERERDRVRVNDRAKEKANKTMGNCWRRRGNERKKASETDRRERRIKTDEQ